MISSGSSICSSGSSSGTGGVSGITCGILLLGSSICSSQTSSLGGVLSDHPLKNIILINQISHHKIPKKRKIFNKIASLDHKCGCSSS
jgi:hypothetical protein